jgi:CHAD domain-containing protein
MAVLELTGALTGPNAVSKAQRRFKKTLKESGLLRDIQVHLKIVSSLRQSGPLSDFKDHLKRRERRAVNGIQKDLRRGGKRRSVKRIRSELAVVFGAQSETQIRRAIERVLKSRRTEVLRARKRLRAGDEETLHNMRLGVKQLRYALEAVQPLFGDSLKQEAQAMRSLQSLLGNARDLELLGADLEAWAARRGSKMAIVPVLETLREKRQDLLGKIQIACQEQRLRPAIEKTFAPEHSTVRPVPPSSRRTA